MGVVTVEAMNLPREMFALQEIDPLLVVGAGMTIRIRPFSGFQGVILRQRLTELVRFVCRLIPEIIMETFGNAGSAGMALTADFESPFKGELPGIDDVSFLRRTYMNRSGPVAFLTSRIQF